MIEIRHNFVLPKNVLERHQKELRRTTLPRAANRLARAARREMLKKVPVLTGATRNSIEAIRVAPFFYHVVVSTPYTLLLEFGYTGAQIVQTHQRLQTHAFGRRISPVRVTVRGHTRFVNRHPRPFIRPGLEVAGERGIPILREEYKNCDESIYPALGNTNSALCKANH